MSKKQDRNQLFNAICVFGGVAALGSSLIYLFVPDGTVKFFGGIPTPTTNTWIPVVAAGDILCAYLLFEAARTSSAEVKRLGVRGLGLYMAFHLGAFVRGHLYSEPQPLQMLAIYASMALGTVPFVLWWGVLHPPRDAGEQVSTEEPN